MKNRRFHSSLKRASIAATALLAGVALPTGASAQETAPSGAEVFETEAVAPHQDIVVVAAPAARVQYAVRPIVTLLAPEIRPETPEERLDRVAYYLRAASAGRCANPEMLTGFALHETGAYDADQRALVERIYRFGRGIGVRHIVTQSAAARSGFLAGDVITHVNGRDIASFETGEIGRSASYDRTARFETFLTAALTSGPAQVTIRRGRKTSTLTLPGQPGCGGKPVLYAKGGLNAWSDGKYVAVTNTMMKFARDDSELAFVVSHEMAHNILDHALKLRGKSMLLASLGIGSSKIKNTEIEADQIGAEILVTAGFPLEGALTLLQRVGPKIPINLATTHPGIKRRLGIVKDAAARLEQTALAARAERERPAQAAGLKDLAYMARSVAIPGIVSVPSLPELLDLPTNQLAQRTISPINPELASRAGPGNDASGLATISFTSDQERTLAQTFGSLRVGNA